MIKLKYGNNYYDMLENFDFEKSSREVKYSNVKIDFTGLTTSDLPKKYQECQIVDGNKVLFTGYADSYSISEMKLEDDSFRSLEIVLLSPMAMATVRTVILKGTYDTKELIRQVLAPLIVDGFTIEELNIDKSQITVNFVLKSIEDCMNKISNAKNIWWYIDENKKIYINDINYQFSKEKVLVYDNKAPKGLIKIEPTIDIADYCNVVNIKNVRVYSSSFYYGDIVYEPLLDTTIKIKEGNEITFNYPIDIKVQNIKKSYEDQASSLSRYSSVISENALPVIYFKGTTNNGIKEFYITLGINDNTLTFSENVIIGGESTTEITYDFELTKDSFFSNLITGFKYNGSETIKEITDIYTINCLKWSNVKFINNKEIEKQIGVISVSGQVEKTINLNEQWKLTSELSEIAKSYLDINSGESNLVKLTSDREIGIKVGDIIEINKPNFLIDDIDYICTDYSYTYYNDYDKLYTYELRNKNYLSNYIDLFRVNDNESSEKQLENIIIFNYVEEVIKEVHEVAN